MLAIPAIQSYINIHSLNIIKYYNSIQIECDVLQGVLIMIL